MCPKVNFLRMPTWERECRSLRELSPGRRPNSKSSNTLSLIIIIKQKITFLNFSVADSIHYFRNTVDSKFSTTKIQIWIILFNVKKFSAGQKPLKQ